MNLKKILIIIGMIPLTTLAQENPLGSPRKALNFYSANLNQAIEVGLPNFNESQLSQRLRQLKQKYPNGAPGHKIQDFSNLARQFGLPTPQVRPGETYVEGTNHALGLDQKSGKLFMHKNLESLPTLSVDDAKKQLPAVNRNHQNVLNQLGVEGGQIFFNESSLLYLQSARDPGEGRAQLTPIQVDGISYFGLRALEGILVDGSNLKLVSKNTQSLEEVDMVWPAVHFHPGLKEFVVKNKKTLSNEALREITQTTSRGDKINVKMAVVLRPVQTSTGQFFIPALKVGVLSAKNEGGHMFYLNLVSDSTPFSEPQMSDPSEGGGN